MLVLKCRDGGGEPLEGLVNGFPSGKPADYFTNSQAQGARDAADQIIRFCESHFPQPG